MTPALRPALAVLLGFAAICPARAAQPYAPPRFAEPDRAGRIRAVLPDVDRAFTDFARERRTPGLVWAVVLDGELFHQGASGFAHLERKIPAASDTRFRIASMSKSFTALAILKLRDSGKLTLEDRVDRHLPEFRPPPLAADAPTLTIRHLLTMTGGFPQDDPWGDRLLAQGAAEFEAFLRGGVSASNPASVAWEYSNFGYAVLGHIVTRAAGEPYQRYIAREILAPLGMKDTRWEYADVPADKLALGYRWENNAWVPEPMLHDGVYGAMGGLITTLPDFARYVAFHLAAWPARDDPDRGPVRRATVREMHKPAEVFSVSDARTLDGESNPQASGYGFGLGWTRDSRGIVRVGHSGGLPGFGSNYAFLPEYGLAVISFANLTYAGTSGTNNKALAILVEKAGLKPRALPPSPILVERTRQVAELVRTWDPAVASTILADNFFLDRSREDWIKRARETLERAGKIVSTGEIVPQNQLRGTFTLQGETGRVEVHFTLTPEPVPRVQELRLTYREAAR